MHGWKRHHRASVNGRDGKRLAKESVMTFGCNEALDVSLPGEFGEEELVQHLGVLVVF